MRFLVELGDRETESCYLCPLNYDSISCEALRGEKPDDLETALCDTDAERRPEWCPLVPVTEDGRPEFTAELLDLVRLMRRCIDVSALVPPALREEVRHRMRELGIEADE